MIIKAEKLHFLCSYIQQNGTHRLYNQPQQFARGKYTSIYWQNAKITIHALGVNLVRRIQLEAPVLLRILVLQVCDLCAQ